MKYPACEFCMSQNYVRWTLQDYRKMKFVNIYNATAIQSLLTSVLLILLN